MKHLGMALLALAAATAPAFAQSLPDQLSSVAPGLSARVVIHAGDDLVGGDQFGEANDFTAFFPTGPRDGHLMVGHELKWAGDDARGGHFTRVKLHDKKMVEAQTWTTGMSLNCAGNVTPWGTILSGEEFPHKSVPNYSKKDYETKWIKASDAPADFGWMYEIDPRGVTPAGKSWRRTAMGRFSHESGVVVGDREVFLTEDYEYGHFFRFVANRARDLSAGTLYAYDRKGARWIRIKDVVNARLEAQKLKATPFNRLEDIQQGPDGKLYFAETGFMEAKDPFGRVWRYDPKTGKADVFLEGDGKRMANPDNLLWDKQGNLYICEDQYEENLKAYGKNEVLMVTPKKEIKTVAVIKEGEPTGPSFHPDGKTLFVSVMNGKNGAVVAIEGFPIR